MNDSRASHLRLADAVAAIAAGTLTARALAEAHLARIAATDAAIEAWACLDPSHVRAEADRCDAVRPSRGPLAGIGVGVKDIFATADLPTEDGSPIFAGHRPAHDAEAVARLRRAGAYVFGKTVTAEFAYFQPGKTRNPWNARHTPGGSSSGSAAAVAAGHVIAALGTQTNGSMIRPAAFCGVVGFKPTKDAIPYAGAFAFSPTLDQVGTFARDVAGAARLASVVADAGRVAAAPAALSRPPRLAWLPGFPWTQIEREGAAALDAAAARLRAAGAEIVAVDFPVPWRDAHLVLRTIMLHEAALRHRALQERERARMSAQLNAALDEGHATPDGDYRTALRRRDEAIGTFTAWLAGFDAVVSPPARGAAPADLASTGDPACCSLWSLTGFPAISIPIGRAAKGLPLGMQLAAPQGA
ncbi:MAG TPA: amidase, partial [Casimicrobiaceae bacterium]|nr:amidase [Casimicrobiaceae bacterium]